MDIRMHGMAQTALMNEWNTALGRSRTSASNYMASVNRAYMTEAYQEPQQMRCKDIAQ